MKTATEHGQHREQRGQWRQEAGRHLVVADIQPSRPQRFVYRILSCVGRTAIIDTPQYYNIFSGLINTIQFKTHTHNILYILPLKSNECITKNMVYVDDLI